MNRRHFLMLAAGSVALMAGCQTAPQTAAPPAGGPSPAGAPAKTTEAARKLKVGLLPIVDVLPMHVAALEGLFGKRQVEVELIPFQSALERDASLQAGALDGQLNDLISASLLNKDADRIRVVRLSHQASPHLAMMVILASPKSEIKTPADLKNVEIGISKNSVIEYSTDRLLLDAGLKPSEIAKVEVTQIPVRAEMLAKDQLKAATLPEPLASLAAMQGARVILNDSQSGIGHSVISFRQEVLKSNPETVKRFFLAYEDAVNTINETPEKYRDLMIDKARVPDALKATAKLPKYPAATVPTEAYLKGVMDWMVGQQLLPAAIPYDKMVDASYLPKA